MWEHTLSKSHKEKIKKTKAIYLEIDTVIEEIAEISNKKREKVHERE